MNFSADIDTTRAVGPAGEEILADGVQQMGLAAPGAAVDEQWVERHLVGGRQRLGGGRGDFIGLADDEGVEAVARIEIGRIGIARTGLAARAAGISSRISNGDGRGRPRRRRFATSRTIGSTVFHASAVARRNASGPSRP